MCVGAQKAGTTWLWYYLKNSKAVDIDYSVKEFHVWDVLTIDEYKFLKLVVGSKVITSEDEPTNLQYLQLKMMETPSEYFYYFIRKLENCHVTGDFTPQYSALSDDTYNHIIDTFAQYDIQTKAIFLMRDPVDRLQSLVRMNFIIEGVYQPSYQAEVGAMLEHCNSITNLYTGDYSTIVPKLDRVFKSNVHYEFYENLFQDKSIKNICTFIDVSFHQPNYNFNPHQHISFNPHPNKTPNVLTESDRLHFENLYQPIYDYTAKRFPEVKKLWTYYQK